MTNKTVTVVRGLPASGKSTWVKTQIGRGDNPAKAVRINNDDLCMMLFGDPFGGRSPETGKLLRSLRENVLRTMLADRNVEHIYVDNTNLHTQTVRSLEKIVHEHGATFEVIDWFLSVPVDECIRRDATRERPVGEGVIRKMARQAEKLYEWKYGPTAKIVPHVNDPALPPAIVVDIDGTLATKYAGRSIYDYSLVSKDNPVQHVVDVVNAFHDRGTRVVVMSGRDDDCYDQTMDWLRANVKFDELHMRRTGDERPDWIVKHELFQKHVADKYNVVLVLDDRDQVVHLWRRRLHLPTFQVADGNF